ncbi:MAG: cysteine dioxygenase family protein [Chitinophagales bacterium]
MLLEKNVLPKSLENLVNILTDALNLYGKITPKLAKKLVVKANVQVKDMMRYAAFDHPTVDCYGRKLVYEDDHFEVMVMSWNPRDYSSIHNHGHTEWGVVQVFGNTHHLVYQLKGNELSFAKKEILPKGAAIKVNNAFIHQMGNATTEPYLTLHVYGSNHAQKAITADAKNFDLELDRIAHTSGGAFFNLPDEKIYDIEEGVEPTREVFMQYAYLLMDYYNRQELTDEIAGLKRDLLKKMETVVISN